MVKKQNIFMLMPLYLDISLKHVTQMRSVRNVRYAYASEHADQPVWLL